MAPCGPLCASDTHSRGGGSARQPLVSPRLPPLPRRVRYGTVVIRGLPFRRRRSRTVWPTQLARRAPPSVGRAPANDRRVARDWPVEIYAAAPPPRSRRSRSRLGGNGAQGDDSGGRQRRRACAVFGLARTGRLTTAYVDAAGLFGRGGRGGSPTVLPPARKRCTLHLHPRRWRRLVARLCAGGGNQCHSAAQRWGRDEWASCVMRGASSWVWATRAPAAAAAPPASAAYNRRRESEHRPRGGRPAPPGLSIGAGCVPLPRAGARRRPRPARVPL